MKALSVISLVFSVVSLGATFGYVAAWVAVESRPHALGALLMASLAMLSFFLWSNAFRLCWMEYKRSRIDG